MSTNNEQRLSDLLVNPVETPEIEIKSWLDPHDDIDRASIAKHLIALANHGGGYLIIGLEEQEDGSYAPAEPRPENLNGFSTDAINALVGRYAEPAFHCTTHLVQHPSSESELKFPIIRVPGSTAPTRSKRDGPGGQKIRQNSYYIRRPGPKSEQPQDGREWDHLVSRCVRENREDLLDAMRAMLSSEPMSKEPTNQEQLDVWTSLSLDRWQEITGDRPEDDPARFAEGHFHVSYMLVGQFEESDLTDLPELLSSAVARHSGLPPFRVPTDPSRAPYLCDETIECWMEGLLPPSEFWKASPDGKMFLIRGLQEDFNDRVPPKTILDADIPIYRMGECLLHAEKLATTLGMEDGEVLFQVTYSGLQGRELSSLDESKRLQYLQEVGSGQYHGRYSRQDRFTKTIQVEIARLRDHLPEVLFELLSPLYLMFGFFKLSRQTVISVVDELKHW